MSTFSNTESIIIASFFSGDAIKYVYVHETISKNCLKIILSQDYNLLFILKYKKYSEYKQFYSLELNRKISMIR